MQKNVKFAKSIAFSLTLLRPSSITHFRLNYKIELDRTDGKFIEYDPNYPEYGGKIFHKHGQFPDRSAFLISM